MIHGSLFLLKGKHGRLYGGCPPILLYHTHKFKSMGENVLAQTWHKCKSPRSFSERGLNFYLQFVSDMVKQRLNKKFYC